MIDSHDDCLICGKPVYDYEPIMCCSGRECGCAGQPLYPCVCSDKCAAAMYSHIGKTFDERRILAGIALWTDNINEVKNEHG